MLTATKALTLPATITGSLPRPVWYTENLENRPFRDAIAYARFREQYTDTGEPGAPAARRDQSVVQGCVPHLNKLDVDVLTFECCTNGGMDLEAIGKAITDRKIAIGVVDHRNLQVECPEQVADLIRRALKYIPVDRLVLSSDSSPEK